MSDTSARRTLRFGILGAALDGWQKECLALLAALPGMTTPVNLVAGAPAAALREQALDFVLCLAPADLPRGWLDVPPQGVWRFQFGDWSTYRSDAPCFWEVYDGCATSAVMLVRVNSDADSVMVLKEVHLRTQTLSPQRNLDQLRARAAPLPSQVCRRLLTGEATSSGAVVRAAAVRRPPTGLQRLVLKTRIAGRAAALGLRSLFRHDQWNVGIVDQSIEHFLAAPTPAAPTPAAPTPAAPVRWLPATPRSELRADPFGVVRDGRATILCEYFSYRDNRGYIVAMNEEGRLVDRVSIGPQPPVHLSYPYLIEHEGRLLCMPESSEAKEISLYEIEQFPDRWTKSSTLIADRGFADASLFEHEGRWWLAASDVADKGANSELHLWHAATPSGPWLPHADNPVKIDVRSARPGGTPFHVDGVLFRPAQDCSTTYGARIIINRVVTLTPTAFLEETACAVNPDPLGPYPDGLHTLSAMGEKTLIDGKRSVFAAAQFFRVLRHYLT